MVRMAHPATCNRRTPVVAVEAGIQGVETLDACQKHAGMTSRYEYAGMTRAWGIGWTRLRFEMGDMAR